MLYRLYLFFIAQAKVFEDLGRGVLSNAWQGFNCSLFAYGQTGSGKSYSMVGYGENKGNDCLYIEFPVITYRDGVSQIVLV